MKTFSGVLALILSGCSLFGMDEFEREVIDVPAHSVTLLTAGARHVAFEFIGELPVPCYEYAGIDVDRMGSRVNVRVRARSTAPICVTMVGRLQVSPLEWKVSDPGEYVFAFWRKDLPPLEVRVQVP